MGRSIVEAYTKRRLLHDLAIRLPQEQPSQSIALRLVKHRKAIGSPHYGERSNGVQLIQKRDRDCYQNQRHHHQGTPLVDAFEQIKQELDEIFSRITEAVLSAPVTQYAADLMRAVSIGRSNAFFKLEKGSRSEEGGGVVA